MTKTVIYPKEFIASWEGIEELEDWIDDMREKGYDWYEDTFIIYTSSIYELNIFFDDIDKVFVNTVIASRYYKENKLYKIGNCFIYEGIPYNVLE